MSVYWPSKQETLDSCKFLNLEAQLFCLIVVGEGQVEIYNVVCRVILPRENKVLVTTSQFTLDVSFSMHGK